MSVKTIILVFWVGWAMRMMGRTCISTRQKEKVGVDLMPEQVTNCTQPYNEKALFRGLFAENVVYHLLL